MDLGLDCLNSPEEAGSILLRNFGIYLLVQMTLQSRSVNLTMREDFQYTKLTVVQRSSDLREEMFLYKVCTVSVLLCVSDTDVYLQGSNQAIWPIAFIVATDKYCTPKVQLPL